MNQGAVTMRRTPVEVLEDIQRFPDHHMHTFKELEACSTFQGLLDQTVFRAHRRFAPIRTIKGTPCDVVEGPCHCGQLH